jgi:glycerol-3-phosphate O-acyltransferase
MATDGGVTQAVFPEGGLSLDGGLATPRLGILKYIIEERSADGRDVVFVPVALNYDRVFEDRILVAAGKAGERRFRARISVIASFILNQFWLRIRGRYHRHGYAAASFGAPVSLDAFLAENPGAGVRQLGALLMKRIGEEVPVLPVPVVASVLLASDGPITEEQLQDRVRDIVGQMPKARVHLPRGDLDYTVEVGLRNLRKRGMVAERPEGIEIVPEEKPLLDFYANSIRHLFCSRSR